MTRRESLNNSGDYLRRVKGAIAIIAAGAVAIGLPACSRGDSMMPKEPSASASSGESTPGANDGTTNGNSPTEKPSRRTITAPPQTNETSGSNPSSEKTSVQPTNPNGLPNAEASDDIYRAEYKKQVEKWHNMPLNSFYELPLEERAKVALLEIQDDARSGFFKEGGYTYGNKNNPDLYKYNPLTVASPNNDPYSVARQADVLAQQATDTLGGWRYNKVDGLKQADALFYGGMKHNKLNENSGMNRGSIEYSIDKVSSKDLNNGGGERLNERIYFPETGERGRWQSPNGEVLVAVRIQGKAKKEDGRWLPFGLTYVFNPRINVWQIVAEKSAVEFTPDNPKVV